MFERRDSVSIDVNGTSLALVEQGTGDPVVLVHGGVSDMRSWAGQLPTMSESFRVLCYSRRYHVPNAPIAPDEPDLFETHVNDLAALTDRLGATPTHVVGHSWGGLIALAFAMQHPDKCRKLVLIEAPTISVHLQIPPKPLQLLKLFLTDPKLALSIAKLGATTFAPAEKAFRNGDDKAAIEHFGRGVLGDEAFEALSEERYRQAWDNRGADRAQALFHGFPDLRDAPLSRVSMPVLLLSGSASPVVFRRLNGALVRRLPDATHRIIPNASHIVQEDAPDAVNAAIMGFLKG